MVIINGAGIAGMTLANLLQASGVAYLLIEKAPKLEALGAGIILQNNGLAILEKLDVLRCLNGHDVNEMCVGYNRQIKVLEAQRMGMKCKVVHRADLQSALLSNIPTSNVRLNVCIKHFDIQGQNVHVNLSDGSTLLGSYLVDGSGINSHLFTQPKLFNSNHWCWRSIVNLRQPIARSGEYWFGKQRLGIAPISHTQAYVFHVIDMQKGESESSYPIDVRQRWIKQQIEVVDDIKQLDFDDAQWLSHPLLDRDINWGQGRLVAIGDAAHAMTPNLGQGAVLAMEDAFELAKLILKDDTNPAQTMRQNRHKRVKAVHKQSRYVGKIAHNEYWAFKIIKRVFFAFMPMSLAVKAQVKWMNQFIKQIEG